MKAFVGNIVLILGASLVGSAAADPPCPISQVAQKYCDHVITVKVKVGKDVDEKVATTITHNGKRVPVGAPDKDGVITLRLDSKQLSSLAIVNKDGELITPSGINDRQTAASRTENVVVGRSIISINGRTSVTESRANVTYKPLAEVNLDVTRRDVNGAKLPPK